MTGRRVPVTVNGVEIRVWPWARWRDAVTAYDSHAGGALSTGEGVVHDEAGEPVDPDGHVVPGAHIHFHEAVKGRSG
jgi:hypothetical protein